MQKILVMGLPGSGKTTMAEELCHAFWEEGRTVSWFNADEIRKANNDWDFSEEGRIRQSIRMFELASNSTNDYVICDFVAPLPEMRDNFKADWLIWMDTIDSGRFEDTNKIFVKPEMYDFCITEKNASILAEHIKNYIIKYPK